MLGLGIDDELTALAPTILWLFVGRIIAGTFGASFTIANAYIADVTPPEERGKAFGMLGAAFGVGFVVGPALGGLLGGFGPRVPFFFAGGLSLANFLYGLVFLTETHPKEKRRPLVPSQIHSFGARANIRGGKNVRTVVLALFVLFLGSAVYPAVWAFWGTARFEWSPRILGLSLAAYGVSNTLTQAVLVGFFTNRWGYRKTAPSSVPLMCNRVMVDATLWVVRTGAPSRAPPRAIRTLDVGAHAEDGRTRDGSGVGLRRCGFFWVGMRGHLGHPRAAFGRRP